MNAWAVVVAAGRGVRFGQPYNKVFYPLSGRSILSRSLDALAGSGLFSGIVLVLGEGDGEDYRALTADEGACPLVKRIVSGGATRQESVYHGLQALPRETELVAIHDAARPFVTETILRETLCEAEKCGACIPGRALVDTVKRLDAQGFAAETFPRDELCAVQTPQCFLKKRILEAHERALSEGFSGTDDATLYERYMGKVRVLMLPDCEKNIKVTTPADVTPALPELRVGTGYDAHRLVEGRRLVLCGVEIPYEKGLLGHSDADVAVHALIDALLGAAALGDIGRHFPDSDERYRGISSMKLLGEVMRLIAKKGFLPVNADLTLVAQRPRLKDFIPAMRENLARAMNLPEDCVNVKATTTEGMGFEGEELGVSAQAATLLRKDSPARPLR